jgi:hypothetical protein
VVGVLLIAQPAEFESHPALIAPNKPLKKANGPEAIITSGDSSATSEEIVSDFVDVSAESVAIVQADGHLDV